jgi:putative NADH-flavin reductase
MRVLVLGASGGVGQQLVRQAAERGHDVTALSRVVSTNTSGRVRSVVDDVLRPGCFHDHLAGHDVVLSSLGLQRRSPNPWSALTSPPDFASRTASSLIAAMRERGVTRVIAVSAAGVGKSAATMNAAMKFLVATSKIGVAYRDLDVMEQLYRRSGLDTCCVRPTRLTDGPLTKQAKVSSGFGLNASIARADVAWWMLQAIELDPFDHVEPIITTTT